MRYHLCHMLRPPIHGLLGYAEVIESVRWGLTELGHEVSVAENALSTGARSIIFGAQMIDAADLMDLPDNTIVYNLEQIANLRPAEVRPAYGVAARQLRVWDYSAANLASWQRLAPTYPPVVVPIAWAPTLRRIPKRDKEDIDVLLYGLPSPERLQVVEELASKWLRVVYACGLYGESRDSLVARAKVVLNVNKYVSQRVFEVVRVSYLLGNAKAVVSDMRPDGEADLEPVVVYAERERLTDAVANLLQDDRARRALESAAAEAMARRDIRDILRRALATKEA